MLYQICVQLKDMLIYYFTHLQVNYLSQFLISACFLPIMKTSGDDVRIILVSSRAHEDAEYDCLYASGKPMKSFESFECYYNTKLFQVSNNKLINAWGYLHSTLYYN